MSALAAAQSCTLVACPNPMQPADRVFTHIPAGQTIAEMIGPDASHSLSVELSGHNVPRDLWGKVRPKPGQTIHATNYPQGGNGGKLVRAALLIIISYYAPYLSGYIQSGGTAWAVGSGLAGAALTAGIMAVGALAVTPMVGQALAVAA